jgi:uncharacterized membrane protein YecN with MAPEG domain
MAREGIGWPAALHPGAVPIVQPQPTREADHAVDAPLVSLYAAVLMLVVLALAFNVSRLRRRHWVGLGTGDHPDLAAAIRAHGNTIETVPIALLLLLLLELGGAPAWTLHGLGVALVLGRLAYAQGLLVHGGGPSAGRMWGTLLTWLVQLAAAVGAAGLALAGAAPS